jgi:hypothetical protein
MCLLREACFYYLFFHYLQEKYMKTSRVLVLCVSILLVLSACTPMQQPPAPVAILPPADAFYFKFGDYTVYNNERLDSNNVVIPGSIYRSSRVIDRVDAGVGDRNSVLAIDTIFVGLTNRVFKVDYTYYLVRDKKVFVYLTGDSPSIYTAIALGFTGNQALKLTFASGVFPNWVQIANLNESVSGEEFMEAYFLTRPVDSIAVTLRITGRSQGKTSLSLNNTPFAVSRYVQTLTRSVSALVNPNIDFSKMAEYDIGLPGEGAPRTIVRSEMKSVTITVPGTGRQVLNGLRTTLVSFQPGK